MRDLPSGRELLRLAQEVFEGELIPLLPVERRLEARLAAAAMAIAWREGEAGEAPYRAVAAAIARLYGEPAPQEPGAWEPLERRLAADLRAGAFTGSRERAAREVLWRLTLARLREGNPRFLAANGFKAS